MSSRTTFRPHSVITNGDMSADITSQVTVLQSLTRVSYQAIWSGGSTPIGTFAIEASNDYELNPDGTVKNSGTWKALPIILDDGTVALSAPITGNSGTGIINADGIAEYAVRCFYDRTSGSGTLNVIVNAKVS